MMRENIKQTSCILEQNAQIINKSVLLEYNVKFLQVYVHIGNRDFIHVIIEIVIYLPLKLVKL